ncbi:MAG: DUF4351 domain-containing protein, partial [Cyanobacteria bacterium J06650_10]
VFSYEKPKVVALDTFNVAFPDFSVLQFNYRVIQLNRLNWRDFLAKENPIAAALMAKMQIAPEDRPKVKAECLRLLVTLKLDPARMQLIIGFVDTYLKLTPAEESVFETALEQVAPDTRGRVVEILTSWERRGIEKGREEGREEGRQSQIEVAIFLLTSQLGQLLPMTSQQIQGLTLIQIKQLNKQALTFNSMDELSEWLTSAETLEGFVGERAEVLSQLRRDVGAIAPKQKQKLLSLSVEQWQALANQALSDVAALDSWLDSLER